MHKVGFLGAHGKLLALGVTVVGVVGMTAGTMLSMALFTDQETDDNTFTTGTIVLDATKIAALSLTTSALMPGDAISSPVTVENDGSAQLRYSISQSSTNADTLALRDELDLTILEEDVDGGCDDADGASVHASAALGASSNLVGDPTQGDDSGDRVLAAAANEVLCFYVTLPLNTPNSAQGATTTTTFTFDAEQTANNP
jgi:predicted ribosomally synthesized peptide with SipW-like signal peptide